MTELQDSLTAAMTDDEPIPEMPDIPRSDVPDDAPTGDCPFISCGRAATHWRWDPQATVDLSDLSHVTLDTPILGAWMPVCALHRGSAIDTDEDATKAGHRLRAVRRDIAAIEALYQAESAKLDRWLESALRGPQRRETFLVTHLLGYLRRLRKADNKLSTKRLPSVTIKSARSQKVVVEDAAAVIVWAEANDYADKILKRGETTVLIGPSGTLPGLKAFLDKQRDGSLTTVTLDSEKVPGIRIDDDRNWGPVVTEDADG